MWIPKHAKKVFSWITFDVYHYEQEMFDGTLQTFEKLKRKDSVEIIVVTQENKLLILHEEQPGRNPFFWLVAWGLEEWETPLQAAQRELWEETWMKSEHWEYIWAYRFSSRIDYASHLFVARWAYKISAQNLDSGEKIEVLACDWEEFKKYVVDKNFRSKELTSELLREIYLWNEEQFKKKIFG